MTDPAAAASEAKNDAAAPAAAAPPAADTAAKSSVSSTGRSAGILNHTPRKVVVDNVYKYLRKNQVDALVASLLSGAEDDLKLFRYKKAATSNHVEMIFEEEGMVDIFMRKFGEEERTNRKGGTMVAYRASDRGKSTDGDGGDDNNRGKGKRGRGNDRDDAAAKRAKMDAEPFTDDSVRDKIVPLWSKPYEAQITTKWREMLRKSAIPCCKGVKKKFLELQKEAKRGNTQRKPPPPLYPWLTRKAGMNVEKVLSSGTVVGYRNKVELTFGYKDAVEEKAAKGDEAKDDKKDGEKGEGKEAEEPKKRGVPAVGFLPRGWRNAVASPHLCPNIPTEFCAVADTIDEFLSTSPLPPYDGSVHQGVWRQVTMRSSTRTGEMMVVVCHAPASGGAGKRECGSDDYTKVWEGERDRLVKMLADVKIERAELNLDDYPGMMGGEEVTTGDKGEIRSHKKSPFEVKAEKKEAKAAKEMRVTSVFFQEFEGLSNPKPEHPVQHLHGKEYLTERLGQCSFRISPGAFFQVTTPGAEILYDVVVDKVKEAAGDKADKALLLDVCCGTGTIGLYCMKEGAGGKVLGVDIAEPAIEDAKANAVLNGYTDKDGQTKFVASRAELVLNKEIRALTRDPANADIPIIAIVDPAREGLHGDVVKALRNCDRIDRLVYVSCNPTGSLVKDASLLCGPPTKKYGGVPFQPTGATPVDMFPMTNHCEMVVTFDRLKEREEEEGNGEKDKAKEGGMEESKAKEKSGDAGDKKKEEAKKET